MKNKKFLKSLAIKIMAGLLAVLMIGSVVFILIECL